MVKKPKHKMFCSKSCRMYHYNRKFKPRRHWEQKIKYAYGLPIGSYKKLLDKQSGGCAICGRERRPDERRFPVDHDHKTNVIRGIVCVTCNVGLGGFQDNPQLLSKAIDYLAEYTLPAKIAFP